MTIHGINGANAPNNPSNLEPLPDASPLSTGSPEELIAQVAVQLEEAGARDADVARHLRRSRTSERRAALDDKRKAAKLQLAGGIVKSSASAAQAAVSIGQSANNLDAAYDTSIGEHATATGDHDLALSSEQSAAQHKARADGLESTGAFIGAGGDGASSIIGYFGDRASIEAEQHDTEAETIGNAADAAEQARESAHRFADKAMQHMAEIEEAKHRAAMAALRG